jgi:hypothetical protein
VNEFAERSAFHELREIHVSFGTIEVVSRDGYGIAG